MARSAPRKARLFSQEPFWRQVFSSYGDKVVVVVLPDFPPMPDSFLFHIRTAASSLNVTDPVAWWREACQVLRVCVCAAQAGVWCSCVCGSRPGFLGCSETARSLSLASNWRVIGTCS